MRKKRLFNYRSCNVPGTRSTRKTVLLMAILIGALIFALTNSAYAPNSIAHSSVRWIGLALIVICILGRTWTSLYVGGRKTVELVTDGPYSIMRNPLYFFSTLGSAGIGAQGGSISLALVGACVGILVFWVMAQQEENVLLQRHRQLYAAYLRRVPRFFPNPYLWRDQERLTIRQSNVLMTFADALLFLLAVPLANAFQHLQMKGMLPILASLP